MWIPWLLLLAVILLLVVEPPVPVRGVLASRRAACSGPFGRGS